MNLEKEQLYQIFNIKNTVIIQELLSVAFGSKPALIFASDKEGAKIIKKIFPKLSIILEKPELNIAHKINHLSLIVIAKNNKLAKSLIKTHINNNMMQIGELLGYPSCCVNSWINRDYDTDSNKAIHKIYENSRNFHFLNNNLFNFSSRLRVYKGMYKDIKKYYRKNNVFEPVIHNLQFISHVPCSYDCKQSKIIGEETYQILNNNLPEFSKQVKSILKRPVLFFDIFNWVIFDGLVNKDGVLKYKKVVPFISLINSKLLNYFKEGNKIIVNNKSVEIFKDKKILYSYKKKNEVDGFILNFGNYKSFDISIYEKQKES